MVSYSGPLQIYQNIAFKNRMIKNQIDTIMAVAYLHGILFTNKGKTFAKFKQKLLHIINQCLLKTQLRITFLFRNT